MRSGHGAWNILTASSPTRREWCHHPWGPVNAAVLRAWRHGPGALHTVVTLTPIGRACSTETPSTRWETLRTATGGKQARVGFSLSLQRPERGSLGTDNLQAEWKNTVDFDEKSGHSDAATTVFLLAEVFPSTLPSCPLVSTGGGEKGSSVRQKWEDMPYNNSKAVYIYLAPIFVLRHKDINLLMWLRVKRTSKSAVYGAVVVASFQGHNGLTLPDKDAEDCDVFWFSPENGRKQKESVVSFKIMLEVTPTSTLHNYIHNLKGQYIRIGHHSNSYAKRIGGSVSPEYCSYL